MEIDLALIADAATVDGAGKLNILGVFDHIQAREFPVRHERMVLVLRFSAGVDEAGTHEVAIVVLDPGGDEVARMDGQIQLGGGRPDAQIRLPQIVHLDGFVFPEAGVYSVEVHVGGELLTTQTLRLSEAARIAQA
ncbi:MAG: hypothetical protein RQ745_10155 [Longimicrobiales bacterium]|nr:hypothetical protein [Longimicrobiales bacterium]